MFWARRRRVSPTCGGVGLTRSKSPVSTGTAETFSIPRARAAAWLKRRRASRVQCSGIGTSMSASDKQFGPGARHPQAHRPGQFVAVGIFQAMDQPPRRPVLEARHRTRARENRRVGERGGRNRPAPGFRRRIGLERRAEALAIGALDEAHGAPALRAQAAMFGNRAAAGEAGRRIDQVERRPAGLFQDERAVFQPVRRRERRWDQPEHSFSLPLFAASRDF